MHIKLAIFLFVWLLIYKPVLGTMLLYGVPASFVGLFTYGKDIIFLLLFLLSVFNMRKFDILSIYFISFLAVNISYLFINDISLTVKLYALRPYLYIVTTFLAFRYAGNISIEQLRIFLKGVVVSIFILSLWSVFTAYIVGYFEFFSSTKYLQAYASISSSDYYSTNLVDDFYTFEGLLGFRLRDLGNSFLSYGNYVALCTITTFAYLITDTKNFMKNNKWYFIFFLICLFLSFSRTATILTFLFLAYTCIRLQKGLPYVFLFTLGGIGVVFYFWEVFYFIYERTYWELFVNDWVAKPELHTGGWMLFLKELTTNPLGNGFGYSAEIISFFDLRVQAKSALMMQGTILSNTGIIGLLLFCMIMVYLLKISRKIYNQYPAESILLEGTVFIYFMIGLTKPAPSDYYFSLFLYLLSGILAQIYFTKKYE